MRPSVGASGSRRESLVEQEPAVVLLVHDDTQVDYGYRPAISGLGPIGNGSHRGFARADGASRGAHRQQ